MIVELAFVGLTVAAWRKASQRGKMTPGRQEVYVNALEYLKDPPSLRSLADTFAKQGCDVQAKMLRKRAAFLDVSPEKKRERSLAYDRGMASADPAAVEKLANAFESQTATGAAQALRNHAAELRRKAKLGETAKRDVDAPQKSDANGTIKHAEVPQ